ncbi:TetR/AcrR family transcriptional regulator [Limnobacter litoralis]|uniref:TetR family transcriptional regulator n=1 Tax=Limnobacter litoralis TaxID=481366 RepID=A0ABQ5YNB5_9BURK|nr:TetR/AcrR family transcriptional regulator [Limnobacter litoralis]GLR26105.1 TetR family transcriptional regulator [Limnobacter litoralis]
MARHLEFDPTEAIAFAVEAFWQFGYGQLSAGKIAEAMAVAKSSLYNTYGSKRELFLESIDHYASNQRSKLLQRASGENVGTVLRQLLLEVVSDNHAGRGCLLANTASEFGSSDDEVRQRVKAGFDGMIEAFANLVQVGQMTGQFSSMVDARRYAAVLVTGVSGLRTLVKCGYSADELECVVESLLAGLVD